MIAIISPAKSLDFSRETFTRTASQPVFQDEAQVLVDVLKKYSPGKLAKLMRINPKLAQLNFERYQEWQLPFTETNAKQAIYAFRGDVFLGIDAPGFKQEDISFAQDHLRILSGLYGLLRPLDLIQPYRLEMSTSLTFRRIKSLYQFWGSKIAIALKEEVLASKEAVLINLASQEYYKVLDEYFRDVNVITPVFKEFKNGQYKFIHVFGKKARGLMTRFIIDRKIDRAEELKLFDYAGYYYNDLLSSGNEWVFTRR